MTTEAYSRRIVGHHVHASRHTAGGLAARAQAVRGADTAARGTSHHSDCGSQYASDAYRNALAERGSRT